MASRHSKVEQFVHIPMGKKSVEILPGIGSTNAARLKEADYIRANELFAAYLKADRKEEPFYALMRAIKIPDDTTDKVIEAFHRYFSKHGTKI